LVFCVDGSFALKNKLKFFADEQFAGLFFWSLSLFSDFKSLSTTALSFRLKKGSFYDFSMILEMGWLLPTLIGY